MNSSRIVVTVILAIGLVVASIWLGFGIAANQAETLIQVAAGAGFLICLFLGQRIWLALIFLTSMQVPIFKGFTSEQLGMFVFVGFSIVIFLLRKLRLHWKFGELDFWRLMVALMILQVYARNPVGLNILGSSSVGARPYFIAFAAILAGVILSKYRVPAREIKWSMWVSIAAAIVMFPLNSWRYGLGRGPDPSSVQVVAGMEGEGAGRVGKFERMARMLSAILVSRISPLKACIRPMWGFLLLLILVMAALSGYRSSVAYVGIMILIGIAYHGGWVSLIISSFMGAMALGGLALLNLAFPLPANVQRALSPFPGTWDSKYVSSADRSSDWRVEMWEAALLTDEWIQNKTFGDGLGMTREELIKLQDLNAGKKGRNTSGMTRQQESMMIVGAYHSGPVQTIRIIGYVGLFVILVAMVRMAVLMHREMMRAKGGEWQAIIWFFGIQIIAYPIYFVLIFGTFEDCVAFIFLQSGLIDLFRNNLPLPAYSPKAPSVYIPLALRQSRVGDSPLVRSS